MKRTIEIVLAALLVAGLSTGCKDEQKDDTTDTTATAETTTTENETTEDAETTADEADAASAEVEVDEPMYIKAAYEVTCVKAKIEDPEKQTAILAEVYPRYGFETAEAFAAAEAEMKDSESVKMALEEKMKGCTVEVAEGFEEAGAAAAEEGEEEEAAKKDAPKKPSLGYEPGSYKGTVSGGGITDGKVTVAVRADGKATGVFTGKREGKGFLISLKGEVGKDGKFRMKGGKGNTAMVTGTVKGDTANGKIDGLINKQKYSVAFTAK